MFLAFAAMTVFCPQPNHGHNEGQDKEEYERTIQLGEPFSPQVHVEGLVDLTPNPAKACDRDQRWDQCGDEQRESVDRALWEVVFQNCEARRIRGVRYDGTPTSWYRARYE